MEKTLIAGYTDWIDKEFLSRAFPEDLCVCIGGERLKNSRQVRVVDRGSVTDPEALSSLLHTWDFGSVFYFCGSLGMLGRTTFDELRELSALMDLLENEKETRVVVAAGCNRAGVKSPMEEQLIAGALGQLEDGCRRRKMECLFLYTPWVCGTDPARFDPALEGLIRKAGREDGTITFPFPENQEIRLISPEDLADLLQRLHDRWVEEEEPHHLCIGASSRCGELVAALEKAVPDITCRCADGQSSIALEKTDSFAREKYGWFPRYDVIRDLTGESAQKGRGGADSAAEGGTGTDKAGKDADLEGARGKSALRYLKFAAELLVGFAIMEALNRFGNVQVKFQMVDFRLLYVLIMGLMYNIPAGLGAGALAGLSLILAYRREGIGFMTLFYEPTNWFPFIIYFAVGAACGYIRTRDRDELAFAAQESALLREKYRFLRNLFLEERQEKQDYRQQIISSRDSFGKIFRITRQLDVISPHLVFLQAMSVIEEVMDNKAVCIYSVGRGRGFARLEAASRDLEAPRSIRLDEYEAVLSQIRENGIFVNTEVDDRLPMYAVGVSRDDEVMLLVMIRKAGPGQMSLYYANLLKILCGLISTSLLRSLDYQTATRENRYVPGTQLLMPRAFLEEMQIAWAMNGKKIASYSLHRLKTEGLGAQETAKRLEGHIRENDIPGLIGERVYLLVSQSTPEGIEIMQERFEKIGITLYEEDFEETMKAAEQEAV